MGKSDNKHIQTSPSPWVMRFVRLIHEPGPVLDLACGQGRHVKTLRGHDYDVVALDRDVSGLNEFFDDDHVEILTADLEADGLERGDPWPLAGRHFGGIIVTNYLFRPLLPHLVAALAPNGVLIYETFAIGNERYGRPSNPDFLLEPGELLEAFRPSLQIVAYEHGKMSGPRPRVVQRICATNATTSANPPISRIG